MVFHRTGSCNISEFSCEREVVRLTLGLHRGQESEQRSRLLSMAVPQAAGRRVGGEHPQQRAPCCPPPGGAPLPALQAARGQRQVCGSSRRTLPAGSQYRLRDTWPDGVLLFRQSTLPRTTVFLGTWAASTATRQVTFPRVNTTGELGTHFLLTSHLGKDEATFEFLKNSNRKLRESLRRPVSQPH